MFRFLLLLLPMFVFAKVKICLNMIVKNEKDVICRCLDSVMPYIDYWVIVDTGSTDGTQKIVKKHLKDIPGKLYERKWKNWGENRNEALELAQGNGDYILFMDADDVLEVDPGYAFDLKADLYHMWRGSDGFSYLKPQIVKSGKPWKWIGVTHEYLGCDEEYSADILTRVQYVTKEGGGDEKRLEKEISDECRFIGRGTEKRTGE